MTLIERLRDPETQWPSGDPIYLGLRCEAVAEIERLNEIVRLYRMVQSSQSAKEPNV